jgi:hypothetical protein
MRRRPFQMTRRQRIWLYSAFILTVLSGGVWAVLWHFYREDPEMALPVENKLLKIHLAGALIFLIALGSSLPKHASKSWEAKINRVPSALFILSILGSLLTAYGILAFVWETSLIHFAHISAGVAMTLLLPLHIFTGRRAEKRRIIRKIP